LDQDFFWRFLQVGHLGIHAHVLAASSLPYLLFSDRKFWAFAESQYLFQRVFVGILAGLRAFSRCLPKGQAVRGSSSLKIKIRSTQEA
jgi:hypothetical protein